MKIGLSYSRCIRDIVDGKVDMQDVLIVIARTDFDPQNDEQWAGIWSGYRESYGLSRPEWSAYPDEDQDRFRDVSIELWKQGKLHQPRQFGAHARRLPYHWLETVLANEDLEKSPAIKDAWNQFQVLAGLTSTKLYQHLG
jgi:hypothetical protein